MNRSKILQLFAEYLDKQNIKLTPNQYNAAKYIVLELAENRLIGAGSGKTFMFKTIERFLSDRAEKILQEI